MHDREGGFSGEDAAAAARRAKGAMHAGGDDVYIAVGANLGDREAAFSAVIAEIQASPDLHLSRASRVFETAPVGPAGQGAYLNAALVLHTTLAPLELLRSLQAIEARLGRDRRREAVRWGPREVDLDILFMGSRVIDLPDLVVPHPRAHERTFVMIPLAELAPDFVHPVLGVSIDEIAASLPDSAGIRAWPAPPGWPSPLLG